MTALQPLLIELGTEELPVKALPGLAQALFDGVLAGLAARGIAVDRADSVRAQFHSNSLKGRPLSGVNSRRRHVR